MFLQAKDTLLGEKKKGLPLRKTVKDSQMNKKAGSPESLQMSPVIKHVGSIEGQRFWKTRMPE